MTQTPPRSCRDSIQGQALVELLIAFGVSMTLFFGVYYLGALIDIRQTTLQASRYAAFQSQAQSDEGLESHVRERFFTPEPGAPKSWTDWHGQPLITGPDAVTLSMQAQPVEAVGSSAVQALAGSYGLPRRDLHRSEVQVNFRNPWGGSGSVMQLKAHTTVLPDPWSAEGAAGVRHALDASALGASLGKAINSVGPVVSWGVGLLENQAPVLPCVNVEVVPPHRLTEADGSAARGCQ